MINLLLPAKPSVMGDIELRLKGLSLAYKVNIDHTLDTMTLTDGESTVKGVNEINDYLDQLSSELHYWHDCGC